MEHDGKSRHLRGLNIDWDRRSCTPYGVAGPVLSQGHFVELPVDTRVQAIVTGQGLFASRS
jgi:hypothetical protein